MPEKQIAATGLGRIYAYGSRSLECETTQDTVNYTIESNAGG
jgi:hypothetical protein